MKIHHPGKWLCAILCLALIGASAWTHRADLSRENLMHLSKTISAPWFIAAFVVLPILGFPISVLLFAAGARFGWGPAAALAAVGIVLHHSIIFRIMHAGMREWVKSWLERRGKKIPNLKPDHRAWFTMLFAAIHGPPYTMKLYLLALTDLPFRFFLGAGAPVYWLFALLPILAGSAIMHFNPLWIYLIVGMTILLMGVGYWLKKRFGDALE